MRSDTSDCAREEILFIAAAPFTEWRRHLPFRNRDPDFGSLFVTPVQFVGGGIHKYFWETEFENRGREARLQGSLEAGRVDEAFPQAELDDPGENRERYPRGSASKQIMAMLWL